MKTLANANDRDEILRRLGRIGPGSQRQWGKMTVAEMVCHLSDALRVSMGEKHPIFGAMNEKDWMRWGYLHMDHHLRQFGV